MLVEILDTTCIKQHNNNKNSNKISRIMVLFDAAAAHKLAYDEVTRKPLTRVRGKPTRMDVELTHKEVCEKLTAIDQPFPTSHGRYGLLGAVMDADEYTEKTGLVYVEKTAPAAYPEDVDENTSAHERKRKEAENAQDNDAFNRQVGAYDGVITLMRDAYDDKYLNKLEKEFIGFAGRHPRELFVHLRTGPAKMNTKAKKAMKDDYERGWDIEGEEGIEEFAKRLRVERKRLTRAGVAYTDDQLLQHYLEEVTKHPDLERKDLSDFDTLQETDGEDMTFEAACEYWEAIFDAMEDFQETRAGGAKKAQYESAAHVEQLRIKQAEGEVSLCQMVSQANTQNETIQSVQQSQTELAKIMQAMRNELKESREESKQLRQEVAALKTRPANNENTNPNSSNGSWGTGNGNRAADEGKRCKHCGGRHVSRPNRKGKILPEEECSGKGWPSSAHKGMPDYFIDMMNKFKGTNVKKADLL